MRRRQLDVPLSLHTQPISIAPQTKIRTSCQSTGRRKSEADGSRCTICVCSRSQHSLTLPAHGIRPDTVHACECRERRLAVFGRRLPTLLVGRRCLTRTATGTSRRTARSFVMIAPYFEPEAVLMAAAPAQGVARGWTLAAGDGSLSSARGSAYWPEKRLMQDLAATVAPA
jgi:hypothetical protein